MGGGGFIENDSYNQHSLPIGGNSLIGFEDPSSVVGNSDGALRKSCPLLRFMTPLNSVDPMVLKTISIGDELSIMVHDGSVVAITANGDVAGSITAIELAQLSACLAAGYTYIGKIEKKVGGTCMIYVYHRHRR